MELNVRTQNSIKIVEMSGELNSDTSASVFETISNQLSDGDRVILDMTKVNYMSSAGIRTLLLLYRALTNVGGHVILVGLSEQLEDTLSITGFLEFFDTKRTLRRGNPCDSVNDCIEQSTCL